MPSYVLKYIVGIIDKFPIYTPGVIPIETVITENGLQIISSDKIHSLNIDIPKTAGITFESPSLNNDEIHKAINLN